MHYQGYETTEVGCDHFRSTSVKLWATVGVDELRDSFFCGWSNYFSFVIINLFNPFNSESKPELWPHYLEKELEF